MRTRSSGLRRPRLLDGLTVLLVVWVCVATSTRPAAAAPPSARVLYERAVVLDRDVRATMGGTRTPATGPEPFRKAIAAYERVVWHHPSSGYCDNALWQASQLAVEAFDRFGQDRDRIAAIASLRRLVKEYPTSGFVKRSRAGIQRLEHLASTVSRSAGSSARPKPSPTRPTSAAETSGAPVSVERVTRHVAAGLTRIVVQLSGPASFREERLSDPARIFFDLAHTQPTDAVKDAILTFADGLVRQIRVGRHPQAITRIVIDAEGVDRYKAELLSAPHRLVVTCWPTTLAATPLPPVLMPGQPAPPDAVRQEAPSRALDEPRKPQATMPEVPATVVVPAAPPPGSAVPSAPVAARPDSPVPFAEERPVPVVPAATPDAATAPRATILSDAPPPATPSSNTAGGYSLARQLGLGASRIVIDAGHGGHDPGAMVGTRTEASITLDIALRLETLLLKQPGVEVVLTRRTDVFVPLQERTAIANREGADLFVSIHVNASQNTRAHGVETYLLDFASNEDAERVAARENASSQMTMSHLNDLVKRIALTTKADESRDLASRVQRSLVRRLRPHNPQLRDLGVKRAPFVVLIGASMPSILVEVAFLTHRQERRLLGTQAYRQQLAESIADGLKRYQQDLKKASPVVLRRDALPPAAEPGVAAARDRIQ